MEFVHENPTSVYILRGGKAVSDGDRDKQKAFIPKDRHRELGQRNRILRKCVSWYDYCFFFSCRRLRLKCDGTRAETRFGLSAKRTSPFKSAGASVQSITGSRDVRISGSNGGYTKFRGSMKRCEGYWLPTPFVSFPFTSPSVRHRVPSGFNWTLHLTLCLFRFLD